MKKLFLLASLLLAFGISADAGDITSPNGQIQVNFTLDGTVPTYSVTYQGKTIIKPSRLGYQLAKGGKDLLSDFSVINEKLPLSMRPGLLFGERISLSAIIIMICW